MYPQRFSQNAVFQLMKGGISHGKRPSFTMQKTAFWDSGGNALVIKQLA